MHIKLVQINIIILILLINFINLLLISVYAIHYLHQKTVISVLYIKNEITFDYFTFNNHKKI